MKPEFIRNQQGTIIKKCCASCAFKKYGPNGNDDKRVCSFGGTNVPTEKDFYCLGYRLSDEMNKVKAKTFIPIKLII